MGVKISVLHQFIAFVRKNYIPYEGQEYQLIAFVIKHYISEGR